jgi:hypothetical protein
MLKRKFAGGVAMRTQHWISIIILGLALAGCDRDEDKRINEGPAERAGRQLDKAASKAAVELDKAAEDAGRTINKAAEVIGEKMEKAGEKVQDSAREARAEEERKKEKEK